MANNNFKSFFPLFVCDFIELRVDNRHQLHQLPVRLSFLSFKFVKSSIVIWIWIFIISNILEFPLQISRQFLLRLYFFMYRLLRWFDVCLWNLSWCIWMFNVQLWINLIRKLTMLLFIKWVRVYWGHCLQILVYLLMIHRLVIIKIRISFIEFLRCLKPFAVWVCANHKLTLLRLNWIGF